MANNWIKIIIGDSRSMKEIKEETVDFIVTSPPYWHIKDYGIPGQIGYGQSLHEYLKQLYYVWQECYRVIRKGGRFCLNIGDQFARSVIYGRYKIIPIHAEFIAQCEQIGFDFMGSIIWQKKTTMNTTGGANVMGSYPYPTNGMVEVDYEYIHIFKKMGPAKKVPKEIKEASKLTNGMVEVDYEYIHIFKKMGPAKKVPKEIKEASKLTKEEWKEYFSGHWYFGGAKQIEHEAMFPEELPKRLIKMFTFVGDTVLDPFVWDAIKVRDLIDSLYNGYPIGYLIAWHSPNVNLKNGQVSEGKKIN